MENKFVLKIDLDALLRRMDKLAERLQQTDSNVNNLDTSLRQCRDITDNNKLDIEDIKRRLLGSMDQLNKQNTNQNLPASGSNVSD